MPDRSACLPRPARRLGLGAAIKDGLLAGAARLGARSILATWGFNLARYVSICLRALPSCYTDARVDYRDFRALGNAAFGAASAGNDQALNFYLRAAIEQDYGFVAELGALNGLRAQQLAALLRSCGRTAPVYGLDITADYQAEHEWRGIMLAPNADTTLAQLAARHGRGLICSNGTLTYYGRAQLAELFALARRLRCDLALCEPNLSVMENRQGPSLCRTRSSLYHLYRALLREAGFTMPDDDGRQIPRTFGQYAEERAYIIART